LDSIQIGGRIKRLRRRKGLSQAALAVALGISASYLNLIEHDRRKVTVPLLFAIAGHLGVEPGELAEGDEGRLLGDLMEMFADAVFADSDVTNLEIQDLARSNPAAARAVLGLYDRFRHSGSRGPDPEPEGETLPFHRATDAISDFLQERLNHFPPLEAATERMREDIDRGGDGFDSGIRTYLNNVFGIEVVYASLPNGIARQLDAGRGQLLVSDLLPGESARFQLALCAVGFAAQREVEAVVADAGLPEGDAPMLAANVLTSYAAAALLMPYEPFLRACRAYRYDIDRLARRFGTSFEQVCHRMTTLQRKGAEGIPLHLVRTDIAGNISKRFSLSGIRIPRHSGACPRWNIYSAFLSPDRINVQLSQMPDGGMFFCVARAVAKGGHRYNAPRRYLSIGIGCAVAHARDLVYSDGMDLGNAGQVVPVGVGCRVCPRLECGQRAHPPAQHRFRFDDSVRPESLYAKMF